MAQARATEALARVELWSGDHASRLRGIRLMEEAIARYRALGSREWKGWALAWLGYAAYYVSGDHERAAELMREGLEHFASTHRRVTVLTFLADVLCEQGAWSDFDAALDRATELCPSDFALGWDYIAWGRAKGASVRGDRVGTARWLKEVAETTDPWSDTGGGTGFLSEAAQLLSRVGDVDGGLRFLELALARPRGLADPLHAQSEILAVHGDPRSALEALDRLPYQDGPWEPRLEWHVTLLRALALLRLGRYGEASTVAMTAWPWATASFAPPCTGTPMPNRSPCSRRWPPLRGLRSAPDSSTRADRSCGSRPLDPPVGCGVGGRAGREAGRAPPAGRRSPSGRRRRASDRPALAECDTHGRTQEPA